MTTGAICCGSITKCTTIPVPIRTTGADGVATFTMERNHLWLHVSKSDVGTSGVIRLWRGESERRRKVVVLDPRIRVHGTVLHADRRPAGRDPARAPRAPQREIRTGAAEGRFTDRSGVAPAVPPGLRPALSKVQRPCSGPDPPDVRGAETGARWTR